MDIKLIAIGIAIFLSVISGHVLGQEAPETDPAADKELTADQKKYMAEHMTLTREAADNLYEEFNKFCMESFGAKAEPLMYEKTGRELRLDDDASWRHVSANSACIAFRTSLPARAHVKYQQGDGTAQTTATDERFFLNHVHYLRGLEPGHEYTYTIVAEDERGEKFESAPATIKAERPDNAIDLPGDMAGPPYEITKPGYYVLTKDLVCDGAGIKIKAKGEVTLDFNGHSLTYDNVRTPPPAGASGNFWLFLNNTAYGLLVERPSQVKVVNGTIRQGEGGGGGQGNGWGSNAIFANGSLEMAGMTIDHYGASSTTVNLPYCPSAKLHHNVIVDKGTSVINRHQGIKNVHLAKGTLRYNLVKRCRHQGLIGGDETTGNEVYVDSYANNAFALSGAAEIRDNFVFGSGYHVCGLGWGSEVKNVGNFIHLKAVKPTGRFEEYGSRSTMVGMRFTIYGDGTKRYENTLHEKNIVSVSAADGGEARGIQWSTGQNTANRVFRDNIIKATAEDEKSAAVTLDLEGNFKAADELLPMIYENSRFIGSTYIVQFGASNPAGSNHRLYNCRLERAGDDSRFTTFRFHQALTTKNNIVRDCEFAKGASLESVTWPKELEGKEDGQKVNFTVQWTLDIKTEPNAAVTITDASGEEAFSGKADEQGRLSVPLSQYTRSAAGRTDHGPYEVAVKKTDGTAKKTVTVDGQKKIEL
jgi:hypothetical protein